MPISRFLVNTSALATCPSLSQSASIGWGAVRRGAWSCALEIAELTALATERGCAAAVAELYQRHGNDCLQHFGGPCAIAIIDTDSASGLLAVDRMGIRSMCYANPTGQFVFGSTADSVADHPKVGRALRQQAIFNYLYCHVVPGPGTIYRTIEKLQPGECLIFRNGAVDKRFYWHLRYNDENNDSSTHWRTDRACCGSRKRAMMGIPESARS